MGKKKQRAQGRAMARKDKENRSQLNFKSILIAFGNTLMLLSLGFFLLSVANHLPDGDLKSYVLQIIPSGTLLVSTLHGLISIVLIQQKNNDLISKLAHPNVFISLLIANLVFGFGYSQVNNPCFGATQADKNQYVVLISKFEKMGNSDEVRTWKDKLIHEMDTTIKNQNVKLISLDKKVATESEAKIQNRCYGAIMIVWGNEGDDYITVNYTAADLFRTDYLRIAGPNEQLDYALGVVEPAVFSAFLKSEGNTEYVLYMISANIQRKKQNLKGSIDLTTKAIEFAIKKNLSKNDLANAYILRGSSRDSSSQKEAITDYSKAIELNIENDIKASAYRGLGQAHIYLHDIPQAMKDFDNALDWSTTNDSKARSYSGLGIMHMSKLFHDLEQSKKQFSKAIELASEEISAEKANAYNNRGVVNYLTGDYQQAIYDYSKAIEIDPEESVKIVAYRNRGIAHYYHNNYPEALKDWEAYVRLGGDDPEILKSIARLKNK